MFTTPLAGVYLITFSYRTYNEEQTQYNYLWLNKNGVQLQESEHLMYYYSAADGIVMFTGGRQVYMRLERGDTIYLKTNYRTGSINKLMFCLQFINN